MLCHHAYIIDNLNTRFLLVSFSACLLYILDCIHIALILSFLLYACSQSISNAFSCYIHNVTCSVWIGTQHSNRSLWFSFAKGYALEDTPSWMPLVNRVSESNLDNYVNIYIYIEIIQNCGVWILPCTTEVNRVNGPYYIILKLSDDNMNVILIN